MRLKTVNLEFLEEAQCKPVFSALAPLTFWNRQYFLDERSCLLVSLASTFTCQKKLLV